MNIVIAERAMKAMADLTPTVRKAFHKQLAFLEHNIQHPSLRAKKYNEASESVASPRQSRLAILFSHPAWRVPHHRYRSSP